MILDATANWFGDADGVICDQNRIKTSYEFHIYFNLDHNVALKNPQGEKA